MGTKENNQDSSRRKIIQETKARIIEKIIDGPKNGEMSRTWLREAEELTTASIRTIGRKEASQAWMQGISILSWLEISAASNIGTTMSELFIKASDKPTKTRRHISGQAAEYRDRLNEATAFAVLKGFLNQTDIGVAIAAGRQINDETDKTSEGFGGNSNEFSKIAEEISDRINNSLKPSN